MKCQNLNIQNRENAENITFYVPFPSIRLREKMSEIQTNSASFDRLIYQKLYDPKIPSGSKSSDFKHLVSQKGIKVELKAKRQNPTDFRHCLYVFF